MTGYQIKLLVLNSHEEGITPIYKKRKYFFVVNVTLNIVNEMPNAVSFFYHLDNGFEFLSWNRYMHARIISVFVVLCRPICSPDSLIKYMYIKIWFRKLKIPMPWAALFYSAVRN